MTQNVRIIVFDDDPTGIQTVHGCLLITQWDRATVRKAFDDACPFFYVFTNTRAYQRDQVRTVISDAVRQILEVNREVGDRLVLISRSDSTLRSHFPLEVSLLAEAVEQEQHTPVDMICLVPAFFEGGRLTKNDTHYLLDGDRLVAASDTEFARDSVFGYTSSHLPSYIEEKTGGQVKAQDVWTVPLSALRHEDLSPLIVRLRTAEQRRFVVVNAENYADLHRMARVVHTLAAEGKQILFQSAASLVKALTHNPDKPLLGAEILADQGSGFFIIGSHVTKTTRQLEQLWQLPGIQPVELEVRQILEDEDRLAERVSALILAAAQAGKTPAVFTSRQELMFESTAARLRAGQRISLFLSRLVAALPFRPSYVVAKGGITSHDVLVHGLQVASARVLGQVLPGVPAIALPEDHPFGPIPYIIFPGNVGDEFALASVAKNFMAQRGNR